MSGKVFPHSECNPFPNYEMHGGESLASDKRGSDLKSGGEEISLLFLFRKMDLERVKNEAPWTFNNHLLVFHRMDEGEDSPKVPLIYTWFWVQVHGVPLGFYFEGIAWQLRDFIGKLLGV